MANTQFAFTTGVEMATYLNGQPNEAQNWSRMERGDDIPTEDYMQISQHYDFCELDAEEISEIEQAYRNGFNSTFVPVE